MAIHLSFCYGSRIKPRTSFILGKVFTHGVNSKPTAYSLYLSWFFKELIDCLYDYMNIILVKKSYTQSISSYIYIYMYSCILLFPVAQQRQCYYKSGECSSYSIHRAEFLSSPNLLLRTRDSWRTNYWSLVCVNSQMKLVLVSARGQTSNRIDELARNNEGKQAKFSFLFHFFSSGLPSEGAAHL